VNKGNLTKLMIPVIALAIVIIIFPVLLNGADSILRDSQTDTSTGVTSALGSGTMAFTQPLYADSVDWVTTVTSSSGTDTPVASTYNGTTDVLTLTGLTHTGTRTLTANYQYDQTDTYTGLGDVVTVAPLIVWVGIIMGVGMTAFVGYRKLRE